jgi:hypothetical protein
MNKFSSCIQNSGSVLIEQSISIHESETKSLAHRQSCYKAIYKIHLTARALKSPKHVARYLRFINLCVSCTLWKCTTRFAHTLTQREMHDGNNNNNTPNNEAPISRTQNKVPFSRRSGAQRREQLAPPWCNESKRNRIAHCLSLSLPLT